MHPAPSPETKVPASGMLIDPPESHRADLPATAADAASEQVDAYTRESSVSAAAAVAGRVARRGSRPRAVVRAPAEPEQYAPPGRAEQMVATRLEEVPQRVDEVSSRKADELRRPEEHALAQRARAGSRIYREFNHTGGNTQVVGTPETLPPSAEVRTADPQMTGGRKTPLPERPQMTWVRLHGEFAVYDSSADGQEVPTADRTRLQDVVEHCKDDDFSVVMVAEGVPDSERRQLLADAIQKTNNASSSQHNPTAVDAQYRGARDARTYTSAANSSLLRETIVVGVADPARVREVAEEVANALVTGTGGNIRSLRFHVDWDERGAPRTYDSLEDAVTGRDSAAKPVVVSVQEFADHLQLPDPPLPGLGRRSGPSDFDVERVVRPGVEALEFAEILDNYGNPTGESLPVTRDHIGMLAETNAGKSAMQHAMIVAIKRGDVKAYREARELGEPNYAHEAVVVLDCKKRDQFTHALSQKIAGMLEQCGDIPEELLREMATVHHTVMGGEGVGVRLNLLRPAEGVTAAEWRRSIDEAIEIMSVKYHDKGGEIYGAVKKHLTETIDKACQLFGIDPQSGRSMFPHGSPATPSGEFISNLVEEVVDESGLKGDYRNNVIGWVKTEIKQLFRGDNGSPLAAEGYDLDPMAVLDNRGITSIDLVNITDAGAQKVTALATLRSLYNACKQRNISEGYLDGYKGIRMTVVIDEANFLDDPNVAEFFTHARDQGLRFAWAKQGDAKGSVHPQVWLNTPGRFMKRSGYRPDMEVFADAAGKTTVDDVASVLPEASQGEGIYKGPEMPRGIRYRAYNPDDPVRMPRSEHSYVVGPEALVRHDGLEMYDYELRKEARSFLATDPLGALISNWAEKNVIQVACGRRMTDIAGELEAGVEQAMASPLEGEMIISEAQIDLEYQMLDPLEREKILCAISEAVINAVNSRPELQYVAPRTRYIELLEAHMLARADGVYLEGWDEAHPELALNVATPNPNYDPNAEGENSWRKYVVEIDGKFAAAKDRISEQRTAGPLDKETVAIYETALGRRLQGATAYEQRDVVNSYMIDATNHIGKVLDAMVKGAPQAAAEVEKAEADIEKAKRNISLLIGSEVVSKPEHIHLAEAGEWPEIRAAALSLVRNEMLAINKVPLAPPQTAALEKLIEDMDLSAFGRAVSYKGVKNVLDERIKKQEDLAIQVDPEELRKLCGVAVGDRYAADQWKTIERLEQKYLETVAYASRVRPNRIFHPMDMLRPGSTIDNNLVVLQREQTDEGPLSMSVRRKQNKSPEADLTFSGQMTEGDYGPWRTFFSRYFLYSKCFIDPPATRRFLALKMNRITAKLWDARQVVGKTAVNAQGKGA